MFTRTPLVETAHIPKPKGVVYTMRKMFAVVAAVALVAFAAPAFAANPFMDVPMNHWAYDAISQLAASGVVNGYPDATFKGNKPMTRYEMATAVARALAVVDMNKASKQDVEMLKKLVVEFKDELDALGVKVENIDSRLAVIEERLGGWKINGDFRFRMDFTDKNHGGITGAPAGSSNDGKASFGFNRARLTFTKYIDDQVTFVGRLRHDNNTDLTGTRWDRFYLDVKLPWEVNMRVGRQNIDYFDEEGLYVDNEGLMFDMDLDGVRFDKEWGMGKFSFYVAREAALDGTNGLLDNGYFAGTVADAYYTYGFMGKIAPSEQWGVRLFGEWYSFDDTNYVAAGNPANDGDDFNTLAANVYVNFTPQISANLSYFMQSYGERWRVTYTDSNGALFTDDGANALQAIVDVSQEAFGFTSFRVEYTKFGQGWLGYKDPYCNYWATGAGVVDPVLMAYTRAGNGNVLPDEVTTLFFRLEQKWNDKWTTYQRYVTADMGTDFRIGGVNAGNFGWGMTDWTFGVKYMYTPGLSFELVYDAADYDNGLELAGTQDDNILRLQTNISF